jgi:glycosyltransferase involved in cell wall biosynthesis
MPFLLLMPSYNQAHYIADAVRSVLAQDDPDWELWIVDNSSDRTPEVMRGFGDPRIRFHHIPARMDPGTCLNWMLERAQGEMFSYLHTDNNLAPDYVRRLRAAMQGRPLALAYCDSRVIDGAGRRIGMNRRGSFDLARMLSLDPLGVPFAATTELARRLGGFSVKDVADDVRFCILAHGLAEFVHVREPILEYRVHDGSRTNEAGGVSGMRSVFLGIFTRMRPELEACGQRPVEVLGQELARRLDDLAWLYEDYWYRMLRRVIEPWWAGEFRIDHLFAAGLLPLPGLQPGRNAPAWSPGLRNAAGQRVSPWRNALVRTYLRMRRREPRGLAQRAEEVLLPWASMALDAAPGSKVSFRVQTLDFRTLWAAGRLEALLGWTPLIDPALAAPPWLRWGPATGSEPLLAGATSPRFQRA